MAEKKKGKPFWWKCFIAIILLTLFILWWGVPTYKKWQADNLVNKLCANDGGIKVYEKIKLPSYMFNKYNQPNVELKYSLKNKSKSKIFFKYKYKDIIGFRNSGDINKLSVWMTKVSVVRIQDGKILGKGVWFTRSGGDPIGPWHPSSYSCPSNLTEWDLAKKVVIKQTNK